VFGGLDHVWKAAQVLAGPGASLEVEFHLAIPSLKVRLKEAASEFHVAMMQPDQWPKDLLDRAKSLDGKLQRIDGMDAAAARQTAEELLSLAADIQAAQTRERSD